MSKTGRSDTIVVSVCFAEPSAVWQKQVSLPAGSCIEDAIQASGFRDAFPGRDPYASGVGVYGVLRGPQFALSPADRVEIYRPLVFDPMESRRRRAQHRAARAKAGPGRETGARRV